MGSSNYSWMNSAGYVNHVDLLDDTQIAKLTIHSSPASTNLHDERTDPIQHILVLTAVQRSFPEGKLLCTCHAVLQRQTAPSRCKNAIGKPVLNSLN